METYETHRGTFPYQVLEEGNPACQHYWREVVLAKQAGIAFAEFRCPACGRHLAQSLGEILPPETWGGQLD